MKMNRHATSVPALAAAGLLTACGGGGGGDEGDPARFSGRNDSMASRISDARALEEATTFKAETVGINFGEEVRDLAGGEDIAFQVFRTSPDAVPTFVVMYNEETTTFGPEHWDSDDYPNEYSIEGPDGTDDIKNLWTYGGSVLEHADGRYWGDWTEGRFIPVDRKYHVPIGIWYDGDPVGLRRVAVIGLETAPGDMPTHDIRARYRGRVRFDTFSANRSDGPRRDFQGDVTFFADFSERTIGGVMDDWRIWNRENNRWEDLSGVSYTVAEAAISGNGFTTTMAPDPTCMECVGIVDSTVAGKFYGPYADETGGTIQAELSDGTVGAGVFYTDQD